MHENQISSAANRFILSFFFFLDYTMRISNFAFRFVWIIKLIVVPSTLMRKFREAKSIFLLLFRSNRLNNLNDFIQSHRSFVQVFFYIYINMQEVIFEQVGVNSRNFEEWKTRYSKLSWRTSPRNVVSPCFIMARIIFAQESFKNRTNVLLMWKDNVTQLFDTPALPQLPFLIEAI